MTLIFNPRQSVLVTCQGNYEVSGVEREKHDVLPCHWHMPVSQHPPTYAISVKRELMAASLIRGSGCFVVNFIPFSLMEKVKRAMGVSGEFLEKISEIGMHEAPCEKLVDCFRLKHAVGWLECEVVDEKEYGDHVVFTGRVVHSYMGVDEKRPFHVEGNEFTTTR